MNVLADPIMNYEVEYDKLSRNLPDQIVAGPPPLTESARFASRVVPQRDKAATCLNKLVPPLR